MSPCSLLLWFFRKENFTQNFHLLKFSSFFSSFKVLKENSTTLCLQYPPCLMDAEEHQLRPVCVKWNRKTHRRRLKSASVYTHPFINIILSWFIFTFNNSTSLTSVCPYSILVYMQLKDKNSFGEAADALVIPRAIHRLWVCDSIDKSLAAAPIIYSKEATWVSVSRLLFATAYLEKTDYSIFCGFIFF